ncbi:MAG: carbohydrate binding domain-containing protein, partial [Planctomycetota bacterium]
MNQIRMHQLILSITLLIGMILTSSAFSQEVENLLMDGGFEEAVLGWGLAIRAPAAATLTIDTNEKRVGQASARIEITDVGDGTSNHNLTLDNNAGIAVEANKTYTVDFWTKAEADRTLIIDALQNQDPWTRLFRVTDLPVTTEWTRIHHTFQADATMSPVVFLFSFVDSKTTIWLDHVRFYEGEFDEEDGGPESAFDPDPEDGVVVEATWVNLSWRPGNFALTHDVYFGESFDA